MADARWNEPWLTSGTVYLGDISNVVSKRSTSTREGVNEDTQLGEGHGVSMQPTWKTASLVRIQKSTQRTTTRACFWFSPTSSKTQPEAPSPHGERTPLALWKNKTAMFADRHLPRIGVC